MANSTSAISSSVALASSARVALHSRQTSGDPIATSTPTCTSAAVLRSRTRAPARPSPNPERLLAVARSLRGRLLLAPAAGAAATGCGVGLLAGTGFLLASLYWLAPNLGYDVS